MKFVFIKIFISFENNFLLERTVWLIHDQNDATHLVTVNNDIAVSNCMSFVMFRIRSREKEMYNVFIFIIPN